MTLLFVIAILLSAVVYYYYINYNNIRGQYAAAKGDAETALFYYQKAYNRKPNVNNTMNYGYLLLREGRYDDAEVILNSAFMLSKITVDDKVRVRMMIALLNWKRGELDEAIEIYEALHEVGENTTVYANLGFLYIEKGDMQKAYEYNKAAYEYNDSNNVILDNYAECCAKLGDKDTAYEVLLKAVSSRMPIAENYYHFAKLLHEKGENAEALKYISRAQSMSINSLSGITMDDINALEKEISDEDR